jgi:hypothetical protein
MVWRVVRVLLAAAGFAFLVVALIDSSNKSHALLHSPLRLVAAFVATSIGLVLWANAWAIIVRAEPGRRVLRQGFYLSQLGKYVPGGIWQAAGMVSRLWRLCRHASGWCRNRRRSSRDCGA